MERSIKVANKGRPFSISASKGAISCSPTYVLQGPARRDAIVTSNPDFEGRLPRLLFIGDVPVTSSLAGASLLFRLLSWYPPADLKICAPVHGSGARIPNVSYSAMNAGFPRLLGSRFGSWYCAWITWRLLANPRWLLSVAREFRPEAVLTISHAGAWVGAWQLARQLGIPLYLIVHDDRAYSDYLPEMMRGWAERNFAEAYRSAAARFCVSPAMAEAYESRYAVPADVVYPSRDSGNASFDEPAPQAGMDRPSLTFAYAGSIHGEDNFRQLEDFARLTDQLGHKLIVFSPQVEPLGRRIGTGCPGVVLRAPVPASDLIHELRDAADCLLITGSFGTDHAEVVRTLFPSKFADYSAMGLPVLVWAPPYASISRFIRENPGSAELVQGRGLDGVREAMGRLASQPALRQQLATAVIAAGRRYFTSEAAWSIVSSRLASKGVGG